ncbi:MAG: hypothetical protein KA248_12010 [Kiritimatiellae bacterium]|nr:hypothetical protein [Kiritimatiellia bacterium]
MWRLKHIPILETENKAEAESKRFEIGYPVLRAQEADAMAVRAGRLAAV